MKAVVVSTVPADRPALKLAACLLDAELARAGYDSVERFNTATMKLGFCQGEFDCWLKTPGRCKIHDAEQAIHAAIPAADGLVFLGPIAFGGWSSAQKRAIDRLICLVTPFFEERAELTHHRPRYTHYPRQHAVGLLSAPDEAQRATFESLNDANALNLMAPARSAAVIDEAHPELWQQKLRLMLEQPVEPGASIVDRAAVRRELLEVAGPEPLSRRSALHSAAFLVGSAKPKGSSASEQLARAFSQALERCGVECRLHFASEFVHEGVPALAAARSIASADLFVLATPLYVDSLPALATRALELVQRVRPAERRDALFVPLINCGFPEPEHTRTAIRITRHFALAAGYEFAGALPLGGGGVVTPDRSLQVARSPVTHIVRAIALAAPSLAVGGAIPAAALDAILKPVLSEFLYRQAGEFGFRLEARRRGIAQRDLRAKPFA